jgi:predicted metal-dependent hydrolase
LLSRIRRRLPETDELTLDGASLAYAIRTGARRTLALQIAPDGRVRVAAPHGTTLATIRAFVRRHADWVRRKQQELSAQAPRELADGLDLPVLGARVMLRFGAETGHARAALRGTELWVQGAPARRRQAIERWYRARAAEHAAARLEHFAPLVGRRPQRLALRGQRTRWGSCSGRGTITLNWRLMQTEPALFDYVLVHELCHLLHRNHSPRFWREVARVMPNFHERRARLRKVAANFLL